MDTERDRKWAITIDGSDDAVGFVALFGLERETGPELAVLVGDPRGLGQGRRPRGGAPGLPFTPSTTTAHTASTPRSRPRTWRRRRSSPTSASSAEGVMRRAIPRARRAGRQRGLGPPPGGVHRRGTPSSPPCRRRPRRADRRPRRRRGVRRLLSLATASTTPRGSPTRCGRRRGVQRPGAAAGPRGARLRAPRTRSRLTATPAGSWKAMRRVPPRWRLGADGPGQRLRARAPGGAGVARRRHASAPPCWSTTRPTRAGRAPGWPQQIRAAERPGWTVAEAPGPEVAGRGSRRLRARLHPDHAPGRRRRSATSSSPTYFRDAARPTRGAGSSGRASHRRRARRRRHRGALRTGILHYYLGGTADAAPARFAVQERRRRAWSGLADRLEAAAQPRRRRAARATAWRRSSAGFANAELPFRTHEVVCDAAEYERLAADRPQTGFFPLYRA